MKIFFFLMINNKKITLITQSYRSHLVVSCQGGHMQGSEGAAAQLLHI